MVKLTPRADGFFQVLWTSAQSQVATMVLQPGQASSGTMERHRGDQVTFGLEGEGVVHAAQGTVALASGELLALEAGEPHRFENTGTAPWKVLIFYAPPEY